MAVGRFLRRVVVLAARYDCEAIASSPLSSSHSSFTGEDIVPSASSSFTTSLLTAQHKTTTTITMDRDSLVYKAKLAEQAERFDEMVQDMYVQFCSFRRLPIIILCWLRRYFGGSRSIPIEYWSCY